MSIAAAGSGVAASAPADSKPSKPSSESRITAMELALASLIAVTLHGASTEEVPGSIAIQWLRDLNPDCVNVPEVPPAPAAAPAPAPAP